MCARNIYNHIWNGAIGQLNLEDPSRSGRCYCLAPEGSPKDRQSSPCSERLSRCSAHFQGLAWTARVKTGFDPHFLAGSVQTD